MRVPAPKQSSGAAACQRAPPCYGTWPSCAVGQLPSALSDRGSAARGRGFVSHLCAGLPCPGFAHTHVMELPLAMPGAPDHTDVHAQTPHICKYLCIILFDELNNWLFTDGKG